MYKRYHRKEITEDFGRKEFDFDKKKEFILYKFYCGNKLSISEWKKVDEKYRNGECSHLRWKKYVRKKYIVNGELDAFEDYIKQCIREEKTFEPITNMINTALATAIFSLFMIEPFKKFISLDENIGITKFLLIGILLIAAIIFLEFAVNLIIGINTMYGIKSKEIYKLNMYNDILKLCQEARKNPNKKHRKN